MNLYFNDLTVCHDVDADLLSIRRFSETFREFHLRTGETRVWAPKAIKDYLRTLPWTAANMTLWQFVLSTFNLRTQGTPSEDPKVEDRFCRSEFFVNMNGSCVRCDQMGMAALTKPKGATYSLSLGLPDGGVWSKLYYEVVEETHGKTKTAHKALCLTEENDVSNSDVSEWCQEAYAVALPICSIEPSAKNVTLRNDHGIDVLRSFARRLVASPYVEAVINSLPFKPRACRFVENIDVDTGIIDLRLHRDDRGLGLAVKTTGTTRDQLERISRLLARQYDV